MLGRGRTAEVAAKLDKRKLRHQVGGRASVEGQTPNLILCALQEHLQQHLRLMLYALQSRPQRMQRLWRIRTAKTRQLHALQESNLMVRGSKALLQRSLPRPV